MQTPRLYVQKEKFCEKTFSPIAILMPFGQRWRFILGTYIGQHSSSTYKVEKNLKSIVGVIGLGLLTLLAAFGFFADSFGVQVNLENVNMPLVLVFVIGALILGQAILRCFSFESVNRYKTAAKIGLTLMVVGGIVTVWVFKIPWGRWTYRDILEAGNVALFTPWYLSQGNNRHHSFFSGHTALSFTVIGYILFLKKEHNARNILLAVFLL